MASYSDYTAYYGSYQYKYYLRPGLVSQDQLNNCSIIRSHAYIEVIGASYISWTSGSFSNHVWSGGLGTYYAKGTHLIHYGDFNVSHDGGGVFPGAHVGGGISTTFLMSGNCSMTLARGEYATIPRASEINSFTASTANLNATYTYKYTPKLATYYNRLRVSIPSVKQIFTVNLGQKAVSQQTGTFVFTAAQLSLILDTISNTNGTVNIGCVIETYSDSTYASKIGESSEAKINMEVPTTITASNPTVKDNNDTVTAITGNSAYIVQNKSNLTIVVPTATVTDIATTTKKATIKKYEVTVNDITKELTAPGTLDFGAISNGENITAKYKVTDSRDNVKESNFTINVLPYAPPTVEIQKCYRSTSTGVDDAVAGTYFTVVAVFKVQSIKIANVEKNSVKSRYIKLGTTSKSTAFTSGVAISMNGVGTGEYEVLVGVTDAFGVESVAPSKVRMAIVPICIDLVKKSVGIGKIPTENNCLEIGFDYLKFGTTKINATQFGQTVYDDGT